jgi:hypothetical protein
VSAQRFQLSGFGPREKRESNSNKRRAEVRCSAEVSRRGLYQPGSI